MWLCSGEALPLQAAGSKLGSCESHSNQHWVRNGARLDGRCFTTGTLCLSVDCSSTSPTFFLLFYCILVLSAQACVKRFFFFLFFWTLLLEKKRRKKKKKTGYLSKLSRFTGELSSSVPQISPPCSLNGWGSLGLCSSAQAKRLESTREYRSLWGESRRECPAAPLRLHTEDFSHTLELFRRGEGNRSKFTAKKRKLQLRFSGSFHTQTLAMDSMYSFVCFSLSLVFLDHIYAAETHGELFVFLFPFVAVLGFVRK